MTAPTNTSTVFPPEDELANALKALRIEHPTLGIPKLHSALLVAHPGWTVSEKRTRKILQNEGLVISANKDPKETKNPGFQYPKSKLIDKLDVGKWTKKVEVKYFDETKGKGLVAKEKIAEGETIWKEDPFILAPEWEIYNLQTSSVSCMYCSTPLTGSSLSVACPASSGSAAYCPARYCSRLCLTRSGRTHPLLCPAQNPASTPLLQFARRTEWMALHALAQCTARILIDVQSDDGNFNDEWDVVRSLAQLGMEERHAHVSAADPDRATWQKAHQLFVQAFKEPAQDVEKKKLARILRKPVPQEILNELFEYDAFLRGLGRMSLNLEAHGGLYVLHSHINHACEPNVSVRHFDQRTALSRITVVAKKDMEPGEELLITYVNPELRRVERQRRLDEWGFGTCSCARCKKDKEEEAQLFQDGKAELEGDEDTSDLAKELKASLGVF